MVSVEEYLHRERFAEFKSEYLDGQVVKIPFPMRNHFAVTANTIISLGSRLRGKPFQTYTSDMRILVKRSGWFTYPDATVVSGQAEFLDVCQDTLLNPVLVVEVFAPYTDRVKKLDMYREIPTVQDYLLIAQDRVHVEHGARRPGGAWLVSSLDHASECVVLESLKVELPLAEIYERVELS